MGNEKEQQTNKGAYLILGRAEVANGLEVGRTFELGSSPIIISNKKEAGVPLPCRPDANYVVLLYPTVKGWEFENKGEPGSVSLNTHINEERRLKDGDLLQIGGTVFHFLEGVGVQSDIYAQLLHLTRVDLQTGAYNKIHFEAVLEDWVNLNNRHGQVFSLIILDLDNFRQVNLDYGHMGGDVSIKQVSDRILKRVRKGDIFCRIGGGEEFALILPETPKESAMKFAEEIREEIAKEPISFTDPIHFEERLIPVTVSLGVEEYQKEISKEAFLKHVDELLYVAKHTGKNKVVGTLST